MPAYGSVCLLCQTRAVLFPPRAALPSLWQPSRLMASAAHSRQKPARMALSPKVAQPSLKKDGPRRNANSPFGGMNQTQARIRDQPRERSQAELKRSTSGHEKEKPAKRDDALYKALKMQTTLTPVPYGKRNLIKSNIADITSFDQFPLLPAVRDSIYTHALPDLVDVAPTPAQRVAIPALLGAESKKHTPKKTGDDDAPQYDQFLLAAETGSGKTLAYLVPIVDAIKRAEVVEKEEETRAKEEAEQEKEQKKNVFELESPRLSGEPHPTAGRPRAIILVPTSELVMQVGQLVKSLSHTVKYRSGLISSAFSGRKIQSNLFSERGIDILVATPHLLSSIAETEPHILSRVTHLVVDEADSLMDRSFVPTTTKIIDRSAPSLKQLVLCSATIPRSLDNQLRKKFPDIRRLVTPNLHAIPRRVNLGVVDVGRNPYHGNKDLACADVIWSLGKAGESSEDADFAPVPGAPKQPKRIVVFVNEREKAAEVAYYLRTKGIDAIALSRDTTEQRQNQILTEFTVSKPPTAPAEIKLGEKEASVPFSMDSNQAPDGSSSHRQLPNTQVLVMTDIGSRGIDTVAVRTVILYDVPHTTIDFIHRLGRVGRMGRRGRGIVLVGKKDRKDVVKEVREGMFRGKALI